ncbi:MAG: AmmeMemoRadiSam system protein B [Bacteroidales bacterium]|jgi:hypothetical protein
MIMNFRISTFCLLVFLLVQACHGQDKQHMETRSDRQPAVAGQFYPGNREDLTNMLRRFFSDPSPVDAKDPLAIIVPHAGYVFSGNTASMAYGQLDRNRKFNHIFLIGSSHTMHFNGASVYARGNFITPLGTVVTDTLAQWLADRYDFISTDPEPHVSEHSLEVQLPFLQYWLNKDFTIVPVIIGGQSESNCRKLAAALGPFFKPENLFVISTDFSHYPSYEDAIESDRKMAGAILTNSAKEFLKAKQKTENAGTKSLVTAMCGWTSVLTLLNITENHPEIEYRKIGYSNSGDTDHGDKQRVVGYFALAAVNRDAEASAPDFFLNDKEKTALLKIARHTLDTYLKERSFPTPDPGSLTDHLLTHAGAFVTLKKNHLLRGCIGNFGPDKPLYTTVQEMAVAAAMNDPRFPPVSNHELADLEIEISVLTPLRKITTPDEIIMGKHGIYIRKGNRSGTFLPQVATETGWSKEEFLGHCSRDKAHLGWEGWKTAELYVYEALVFSEHEFRDNL